MRQALFTEPRQFAPRGKGLITRAAGGWLYVLVCPSRKGINLGISVKTSLKSSLPLAGGDVSQIINREIIEIPFAPRKRGCFYFC